MKNLLFILFIFVSLASKAQYPSQQNPTQFSTGWFKQGWHQADSGHILSVRVPNFTPRFAGTTILYQEAGVDSSIYYYNGGRWLKLSQFDSTSLSNRINLKVNISDTASMLLPYLRKVDTLDKWVQDIYVRNDSLFKYKNGTETFLDTLGGGGGGPGTVTSVALSMPSAFSVSGSPITGSGTFNVSGAGTTAQYIRGNGTLATTDTGMIPDFYLKVRGLFSGTSPITFNTTTGAIGISNANTSGTKGAASFTSTGFSDNGSGLIDLVDVTTAGGCINCDITFDSKGRAISFTSGTPPQFVNAPGAGDTLSILDTLKRLNAGYGISHIVTNYNITHEVDTSEIATQYDLTLVNNGVSRSGDTTQWGQAIGASGDPAALTHNTEIPLNGFNSVFTGTGGIGIGTSTVGNRRLSISATSTTQGVDITTVDGSGINVVTSGATSNALFAQVSGSGTAIRGSSSGAGTGYGILASASTHSAIPFKANIFSNLTNSATPVVTEFVRNVSGVPGDGVGLTLMFRGQTTTTTDVETGQIRNYLSTANHGTRSSAFEFHLVNNTTSARKALLSASGQWTWDGYPSLTAQTDSTTYKPIAYDASGNIVPMANWVGAGGSGGTNSNIGIGYRWAVPGTNDIKTVYDSNTILWDSTSNANGLTPKADTSVLGTQYDLSLKLNSSDTTDQWINDIRRVTGTDTVEKFKNGNWQFAYVDSVGLSGATLYGTLYDENSWASVGADWTTSGGTWAISSNKITFTGGNQAISATVGTNNSAFNQSLRLTSYGHSMLSRCKVGFKIIMTSAPGATSYGFAVGKISTNTVGLPSNSMAYFNTSTNTGTGKIYLLTGQLNTTTAISANAVPVNQNDTFYVTWERNLDQATVTVQNISQDTTFATVSYTYNMTVASGRLVDNTGYFSIASLGGDFTIDSVTVTSNEVKNANLLFLTDSKGEYNAPWSLNFPHLVGKQYWGTISCADQSGKSQDVINRLPEILALSPQQVIIAQTRNDLFASTPTATWRQNLITIDSTLRANGIAVYLLDGIYETSINQGDMVRWIDTTFDDRVIHTYYPTNVTGTVATDNVHPTTLGQRIVSDVILNFPLLSNHAKYLNDTYNSQIRNPAYDSIGMTGGIRWLDITLPDTYNSTDIVMPGGAAITAAISPTWKSRIVPQSTTTAAMEFYQHYGQATSCVGCNGGFRWYTGLHTAGSTNRVASLSVGGVFTTGPSPQGGFSSQDYDIGVPQGSAFFSAAASTVGQEARLVLSESSTQYTSLRNYMSNAYMNFFVSGGTLGDQLNALSIHPLGMVGINKSAPVFGLDINRSVGANKDSVTTIPSISSHFLLVIDTAAGSEQGKFKKVLASSISGITSLNTLTAATQTFATGTSGTDFNISSTTSTHTFNLPSASTSNRGLITTISQTFGGQKTFNDGVIVTNSNEAGRVILSGNISSSVAPGVAGVGVQAAAFTYTSTAGAGTETSGQNFHLFGAPTLTSANAISYTGDVSSVRFTGAPIAAGSTTIDHPYNIFAVDVSKFNGIALSLNEQSGDAALATASGVVIYTGAGGNTFTLPALATHPGKIILIKNAGGGNLTVQRAGADNLYDTASVTSVTVAAGASVKLAAGTAFWYVIN